MSPSLAFRGLATRLGFGDLAARYYHAPLSDLKQMIREGGPIEQSRTEEGRLAMISAAARLPPLTPPTSGGGLSVSFLSGEKYWYQTLFCAYSLQRSSQVLITPVIYDDGSFTTATLGAIARVIPWVRFVTAAEINVRLDRHLPADRFPTLRARRLEYPHLRKLTDVHAGGQDWTLVLDSDMLFFRRPDALLSWLEAPDRPCHMFDVETAYGYPDDFMTELAGGPVPERINVGICGLRSRDIDWTQVESWCVAMRDRHRPNYLQEQALSALLLSKGDIHGFDAADYLVKPGLAEGKRPTAALHHYVGESKRSYFQHGWRLCLPVAEPSL